MDITAYPATAQKSAQELHEVIVAHNEAMKTAMLKLIGTRPDLSDLPDEALDAAILICKAMATLMEAVSE